MRLKIRQFITILTALALVAGGFGREAAALALIEPCHTHQTSGHSAHAEAEGHAEHHPQVTHDEQRQQDRGTPGVPADSACFKCCVICTAAPNLTDAAAPVGGTFVAFPVSYFAPILAFTDRPLVIDPGIPKRIA